MQVSARLLAAGGTALALGVLLLAAGLTGAAGDKPLVWKPVIPQQDAADVVKYLGELTQQALDKGPPAGKDEKADWDARLKNTGLLIAAVTASARGSDSDELAAARAAGVQLSEQMDKGDLDGAKTTAAALAALKPTARGGKSITAEDTDLGDIMNLLRLRSKGGLGFGVKPPTGPATADGIEARLINMAKPAQVAAVLKNQADDLARSAYILVAVSEVCDAHPPKKKGTNGKGAKEWADWTEEMRTSALQLAEAAKKKDTAGVRAAVSKLNGTCSNCHGEFRD
jgi:hypothetical protein